MATAAQRTARSPASRFCSFKKERVVNAIVFDLDFEQLRTHYGDSYNNAYLESCRVLEEHFLPIAARPCRLRRFRRHCGQCDACRHRSNADASLVRFRGPLHPHVAN